MKQEEIPLRRADGSTMRTRLYLAEGFPQPMPAVVVIFDVFGMTHDLDRVAARFAAEGYCVLIPDLFDHPGPRIFCVVSAVRSAMRGTGREFDDIKVARDYLNSRPEIDSQRVAIAGFCLGGGFAIVLGSSGMYKVSAPFYGEVPRKIDALRGSCPMVASYGQRDRPSMVQSAHRLEAFLEELQVPHDLKIYPDAGHSFMNRHTGFLAEKIAPHLPMHSEYHEPSAEDAWRRLFSFFAVHLNERPAPTAPAYSSSPLA